MTKALNAVNVEELTNYTNHDYDPIKQHGGIHGLFGPAHHPPTMNDTTETYNTSTPKPTPTHPHITTTYSAQ